MATVLNPSVPYTHTLTRPGTVGLLVQVEGVVQSEATRLAINFKTQDGHTAFHFNPRFTEDAVVLNDRQDAWGCEERVPCVKLERGKAFKLTFLIESDKFVVVLDNERYCHFNHRVAKELINSVEVYGDLEITSIHEGTAFTTEGPIINPAVPYTFHLAEGFSTERILLIYGESTGDQFSINLQCGHEPFKNVAMHLNPRFDQNALVLNDCKDGNWGDEQKFDLLIKPGQSFVVEIVSHAESFHVRVNGADIGDFEHRHAGERPLHCLDVLHICGSVKIHQLRL